MTTLKTFLFFTILVSFLLVFSQVPVVQAQVGINGASAAVICRAISFLADTASRGP